MNALLVQIETKLVAIDTKPKRNYLALNGCSLFIGKSNTKLSGGFNETNQCHKGHSAHLGTATCPSLKLVHKFEKGDNLMKHVYLAYGGNG